MTPQILALWAPSTAELVVIAIIGLLLFGRKLPEYARAAGASVWELKRGFIEGETEKETNERSS